MCGILKKDKSKWDDGMSVENITLRCWNEETDNIGDDPMERVDEVQLKLVVPRWKSHLKHLRGFINSLDTTCRVSSFMTTIMVSYHSESCISQQ